jgi:serine/threonine protein kinase/ankyrin repeat protein
MSSSNDPTDPNAVGQTGTARIEAPQGRAGTARIDARGPAGTARVGVSGPAGTARIQAQGPAGTVRVAATPDMGAGGTLRVGSAAAAATAAVPADDDGALHLGVGQVVVLKGRRYRIESALSTTTSEARTYIVSEGLRRLVLKHYRPGIQAPQAVLARIQAAPHAHVVSIVDFGSQDGQDFEILSYMAGGTLDQLLRTKGPIRDVAQLRLLTANIVDGLAHLHEQVGVIYQDLKPENILISGPDLEEVVLADFGISTLRQAGSPDVQVTANGTREYAAPELARFGNETKTFVTDKVDYFALGITLLECWQGSRPFQGMVEGRRAALIQDRDVPFPPGMDASLEILIKGLISPSAKERFGQAQVRRWMAGQALTVDYSGTQRQYDIKHFPSGESFQNPEQLAALIEKYPEVGKDFLYYDSIQKWLDGSGDMGLSTDIRKIVVQYNQDEDQKNAGLLRAVYVLDKNRPFASAAGRTCATLEDLADALLAEKDHYVVSLRKAFDPFYLYLQARGEGEFATETLSKFVSTISAELAFSQLIYAMHGAGRNRIQIAGQYFFLPEELKDAPAAVQAEVVQSLRQPESRLLLWLQRLAFIEKLLPLPVAEPQDQLGIVRAMPWLRLADFVPDLIARQGMIARHLLRRRRTDLFDVFLAQGLGFNAIDEDALPLVVAVVMGNAELVSYMLDHGADIHMTDGDGDTALATAIQFRHRGLVDLLLTRGGNVHAIDAHGRTSLGHALTVSNFNNTRRTVDGALVDRLLEVGVDVNQPTHGDHLPLHMALLCDPMESVPGLLESLLKAGADIHRTGPNLVVNGQGPCNALFCALYAYHFQFDAKAAYLPVIAGLLQAGARIAETDQDKAPLHWAAAWGDEALAKLLIARGARVDQVVGDDMLPGTYARLAGAQALDGLLDPGTALRQQSRWHKGRSQLLKSLAILLLMAPMVPVGAVLPFMWQTGRLESGLWAIGVTVVVLLAGRLVLSGGWVNFKLGLRRSLSSLPGWLGLFLVQPALLAGVAAGLVGLLRQSGDDHLWLRALTQHVWIDLAVALAAVAVAARSSTRTAAQVRPLDRYRAASTGGQDAPPAGRSETAVITGVLTLVIGVPFVLALRLSGSQLGPSAPNSSAPGSTSVPSPVPAPSLDAIVPKAQPGQSKAAGETLDGALTAPFPVFDSGRTICVLPSGTPLTRLHDAPRNFPEPRLLATVANPPAACATRMAGHEVAIPAARIRKGQADNAARPAHLPQPADAAPAKPAPSTARAVSGAVQGLSADGWPNVAGRVVRLQGLTAIAPEQRKRFESWLAGHENTLQCEPQAGGTYRCLTNAHADVAEALLLNGAATATGDAPAAYKDAMARAMAEKRGQWK